MITSAYILIATIVAFMLGFSFLHIRGIRPIAHACVTGILCALTHDLFQSAGLTAYHFWCETGILVLSTFVACLWLRCKWGAAVHILLVAQSAIGVFLIPVCVCEALGLIAIGIGIFTIQSYFYKFFSRNCFFTQKGGLFVHYVLQ